MTHLSTAEWKRHPAAFCLYVLSALLLCLVVDLPAQDTPVAPVDPLTESWTQSHSRMQSGSFKEAAGGFEQFTQKAPADDARLPEALFQQGLCLSRDKGSAFASALRVWESLLRRFPSSEWSAKALGEIILYYSNLNDPKAATYRRQLVEQFPGSPATVAIIGAEADKFFAEKKYAEAAKAYGQIENHLDETKRKNLHLAKALAEAGSDPRKLMEAADTVFLSGGDEQKDILQTARDLYLEALKGQNRLSKDELARLKTRLGWAYYQGTPDWKDIDKAEALWREVIAQNPKDNEWAIESRWYLVYLLAGPKNMDKPGEWKNAVKMCEEIMDASPLEHFRREQAMFVRAWLYWAWKDYQAALPLYEEYGKAYPSSKKQPAIQNYIKQCREKIGM